MASAKLQICKSSKRNKASLPFSFPAAQALGRACMWLVRPRLPEHGPLHLMEPIRLAVHLQARGNCKAAEYGEQTVQE